MKILVIDDREDNLLVVSALLKYVLPESHIKTAQTGADGLRLALSGQPDIILLDIQMPGMDGFEVCKRLKDDERTQQISVIMLTALKTDSASRIKGLELGADAFLTKPIDEAELVAQLRVMMRIKDAEKLLRQEKRILERLVAERTRSLQESSEQLRRINHILLVRSECNRALATAGDEIEYFRKLCRIFIDIGHYRMVWVGVPEDDPEKTIKPLVGAGFENGYLDAIKITWSDQEEFSAPAGKAISSGKIVIHRNLTQTSADQAWRKEALQRGYLSLAAMPFMLGQKVIGVISLYAEVTDAFDDSTASQLEAIAGDVSYGVSMFRLRHEKEELKHQVQQSQRREAIGTLAGGIAHDFNNILFPIIGYAEMSLEESHEDSRSRDYLREIIKAADRAKELVDHILSFSRTNVQEKNPIRPQYIVKDALKLIRATLPATISISQSIPKECGMVLANPIQLHQILMNLCINAYHAMQQDGGALTIELRETALTAAEIPPNWRMSPGPCLSLTIADTGHGINHLIREKIFSPFFTTKSEGKGTGLGLSVVQDIVMDLGGAIHLDSEPGRGTTFIIYFPLSGLNAEKVADAPALELSKGRMESILIVDDEPQIALLAARMLNELGYQSVSVTDSLEALALFRNKPQAFDLLLTDQTMPGMTGDRLLREVRSLRPDLPVVMCTGFSEYMTRERALELGINEYIMKPVVRQDLAEALRRALAQ